MTKFSVYEQELFGSIHYRVVRNDGRAPFDDGSLQVDFDTEDDAVQSIMGHCRRTKLGLHTIRVLSMDRRRERVIAS